MAKEQQDRAGLGSLAEIRAEIAAAEECGREIAEFHVPDGGNVGFALIKLAQICLGLCDRVAELEDRVNSCEGWQYRHEP